MAGLLATDVKVLPETWASFIDECLRSRNGASAGLPKDSYELRRSMQGLRMIGETKQDKGKSRRKKREKSREIRGRGVWREQDQL